ncbi:MAG: peptidase S8 [Citrobacter freundii]|nr:MAG: peptidase S8 [Citrobacter freundii]
MSFQVLNRPPKQKSNMRFFPVRLLLVLIIAGSYSKSFAQQETGNAAKAAMRQAAHAKLMSLAKEKNWDTLITRPDGYIARLTGVDQTGAPIYLETHNNIVAAATIGTNQLWSGGSLGLTLSGSSTVVSGKLAIWDGGKVRSTHVELNNRVTQVDNATSNNDHATHVAGTMIATGVNPLAKGMSFGYTNLRAYDFDNDDDEMKDAAPNLLVSNHSYGTVAGWNFNSDQNRWEFFGRPLATEDYKFGYYSNDTRIWDSMAYRNPNYLIVKSAGNSRNQNGPAVGENYWRYNESNVMVNAGARPEGISSNNGYDILPTNAVAKNILTIGAVNPIPGGYTNSTDVVMSAFSSWGPTDDGRIKPDLVADGVNLLSSLGSSNNAYGSLSGTSMSSPTIAGSALLLQEYYAQLHSNAFMRSATLKGLLIHTADEAGPAPGPDYQFGWGLANIKKAAEVIKANNTGHLIQENTLTNGQKFTLPVIASGDGVLRATLSWTDPEATVEPIATALDNPTVKLVNDLDIVIKKGATTYQPWTLPPSAPDAAATRGNNTLDNVEKIELTDVVPGDTYTIEITHKGTLQKAPQAYSLLVSGVGTASYCASAASSSAGARIDSVSFGNIRQRNAGNCTTYTSYLNQTGNVEQGQTLPFFIHLNSCDAGTANKIVKVFIDANNDGDFDDAGENIATSSAINGDGDFATTVTIPSSLAAGRYTVMRIVMEETSTASDVTPCGSYARGETQDYRLLITAPSTDIGVTSLATPDAANCGGAGQYISTKIRNYGTASKTNFAISAVVKQGATTVATINETVKESVGAQSEALHTFQTPVSFTSGQSYTITITTTLAQDQNTSNNTATFPVVSRAQTAAPTGTASICNNVAQLIVTSDASRAPYNWYSSATAPTPLATGTIATTTTQQSSYFLSSGEVGKLGPANKMVFTQGEYLSGSGSGNKFTVTTPFTLKTARLYIKSGGKLTFELRRIASESATGYSYYVPAVSSTVVDVYDTSPTTDPTGNDPSDEGAVYALNINFPEAGDYYLAVLPSGGASIFRNINIPTTSYPYTIPGVVSITRASANTTNDPEAGLKLYNYYYDMQVEMATCPSPRAEIVATTNPVPVISANGNVLTSSIATGNQWYLDGSTIPGATANTYTATANGVYTVVVTANNCSSTSNSITVTTTAVPNVDPAEIGMKVMPNPAPGGRFTLQMQTITRSDLDIKLVNVAGQQVYKTRIPGFSGSLTKQIDPGKLAPGVYYLQVIHDKKSYIKKIVVLE